MGNSLDRGVLINFFRKLLGSLVAFSMTILFYIAIIMALVGVALFAYVPAILVATLSAYIAFTRANPLDLRPYVLTQSSWLQYYQVSEHHLQDYLRFEQSRFNEIEQTREKLFQNIVFQGMVATLMAFGIVYSVYHCGGYFGNIPKFIQYYAILLCAPLTLLGYWLGDKYRHTQEYSKLLHDKYKFLIIDLINNHIPRSKILNHKTPLNNELDLLSDLAALQIGQDFRVVLTELGAPTNIGDYQLKQGREVWHYPSFSLSISLEGRYVDILFDESSGSLGWLNHLFWY